MPCVGCLQEYDQNAGEATRNRKLLDIEVEETEELKKQRMVSKQALHVVWVWKWWLRRGRMAMV